MAIITEAPELDFSLPMSVLLRTGTSEIHDAIGKSQGAGWLTRGELDKDEYVRFLMMLWHVYSILEEALERHASYPTLQPTYNPTILARAENIEADISFLLETNVSLWKEHPIHTSLLSSPPQPFAEYTSRLKVLADSADPSPLLAHAYVRYLGDLSGGQIIRGRLIKAYDLDSAKGYGIALYDFKQLGGTQPATMGDVKKIKEWFKRGMDAAIGDNKGLKAEILQEAIRAFNLNNAVFADLKAPSNQFASNEPSVPPLGQPNSPIEKEVPELREIPIQIEQPPQERMVTLSGVLAVVTAVCLAHFLLVIGGFTSTRGYEKLAVLEQWLDGLFQTTSD